MSRKDFIPLSRQQGAVLFFKHAVLCIIGLLLFTAHVNAQVRPVTNAINALPEPIPGSISPITQTLNAGDRVSQLNSNRASGGNGDFKYQWQSSIAGGNWENISGETQLVYFPPPVSVTTYYQLLVTSNNQTVPSARVTVNIRNPIPPLVPGDIIPGGQAVNYGGTATMSSNAPTGGGGPGSYSYRWTSSTDAINFSDITTGVTYLSSYTSLPLTTTTYYRLVTTSGSSSGIRSATVQVYPQLFSGTIAGNQTISTGIIPSWLTGQLPRGGTGTYTYQWQSSTGGSGFNNISGATDINYQPAGLYATTSYQLISSDSNGAKVTSNVITVNVLPQVTPGAINPITQTLNSGDNVAQLNADWPSGGDGSYQYQWQSSVAGGSWGNISGADQRAYSPPPLSVTTYYQLLVTSHGETVASSRVTVNIKEPLPPVVPGNIIPGGQAVNYGGTATMTSESPTGGGGPGSYSYQWTSSTDAINFSPITTGVTNLSGYTSLSLTTTTYYRLVTTSGKLSAISSASVQVYPQLFSGTITGNQSINSGTKPSLLTGQAPTGGSGTNTYQWQSSTGGSSFSDIPDTASTHLNYQPPALSATTSYQLISNSNGAKVTSNVVTVTIYPPIVVGALTPAFQTVPYNSSSVTFTVSPETTGGAGSGTYGYQWTSSKDGITYNNVPLNVNALSYTERSSFKSSMYYRLVVTSNGVSVNSNAGYVSVIVPPLISGTLSPASQDVSYNGGGSLSVTEATGGINTYSHQWQVSTDNSAWNNIPGADSLAYNPKGLTSSAYYRLVTTSGDVSVNSSSGYINVSPLNTTRGHTIRILYANNNTIALSDTTNSTLAVMYRAITNSDDTRSLVKGNGTTDYYDAGELYVTISRDENQPASGRSGTIEEYKDKEGNTVLKRNFNYTGSPAALQILSTYYVYDDFGNLAFVLPPGANPDGGIVSQTDLDLYCYQYHYDSKKRLVEKKIPGRGWEFMIYNKLNQVVLTRDANQIASSTPGASFFRYDGLGRIVVQGIYGYPIADASYFTRPVIQTLFNAEPYFWEMPSDAGPTGYTSRTLPEGESFISNYTIINYYDNYNFPGASTYKYPAGSQKTQGLLTGTKTLVLGTSDMLLSINYYNDKGQLSKVYQQHYLSGTINPDNYDEISYVYNFDGSEKSSSRIHHNAAIGNTTIANRYAYDHVGRKLKGYEQINSDPEVLLDSYNYNEIGQLRAKSLSNNQQTSNYTYNELGWLKISTSNEFSFRLNYEDGVNPQYNGNISGQSWGAGAILNSSFVYIYDKLNRLNSGIGTGMSEQLTYDVMGNIRSLNRDELTRNYEYNGNQLVRTTGGPETSSYQYDVNGNTTVDGRNGQTISYNFLNLPSAVEGLNLSYVYDAKGNKLKKISKGIVTDYIDGIQYSKGAIEFIQTEEGVARRNGNGYTYEYNLTDHLGNVRFSFHTNPVTGQFERLQSDDYYPFGLRKSGNPVSLNNKYLYNGKELQEELGQYDYGARFYDPVIGRWNVIDNKSEKFTNISSYTYAGNNPIAFMDPDGNDLVYFNSKGDEVSRTSSKTEFRTFVDVNGTYHEASMPKIIKGYGSPIFQKYDYNIAAQTYIFNNLPDNQLPKTPGGLSLTGDRPDDLDPTLVKAMITEETNSGTLEGAYGQKGKSDIMQTNVTTTSGQTDWSDSKKSFGLEKGKSATPNQSVRAGVRMLYTKGLQTIPIKDKKGKIIGYTVTWRGDNWNSAVKRYNGGGNANYLEEVLNFLSNAFDGDTENYNQPEKKKK